MVHVAMLKQPLRLWLVGTLAFLALFSEGAMYDWSTVYIKEILRPDPHYNYLGYALFSTGMTLGRLTGDRLRKRAGDAKLLTRQGGGEIDKRRQALHRANRKRTALQRANGLHLFNTFIEMMHRQLGAVQEQPTGHGQFDLTGGADEQHRVQLLFQRLDGGRERRLHDMAALRRAGKVLFFSHRNKMPNLP